MYTSTGSLKKWSKELKPATIPGNQEVKLESATCVAKSKARVMENVR